MAKSMEGASEKEITDFETQMIELEDAMLNSLPNKYKPLVEVAQVVSHTEPVLRDAHTQTM